MKLYYLQKVGINIIEDTISIKKSREKQLSFSLNEVTKVSIVKSGTKDFQAWDLLRLLSKFNFFHNQQANASSIYYITVSFKNRNPIRIEAKNFDLITVSNEIKKLNLFLDSRTDNFPK